MEIVKFILTIISTLTSVVALIWSLTLFKINIAINRRNDYLRNLEKRVIELCDQLTVGEFRRAVREYQTLLLFFQASNAEQYKRLSIEVIDYWFSIETRRAALLTIIGNSYSALSMLLAGKIKNYSESIELFSDQLSHKSVDANTIVEFDPDTNAIAIRTLCSELLKELNNDSVAYKKGGHK